MKDAGFELKVIKSVYTNVYLVTVDLSMDEYMTEAEIIKLTVRHEDENVKDRFINSKMNDFSSFFSKHKQVIIEKKLTRLFSTEYLLANNITMVPAHNP
jgi:hypothetical protein